MLKKIFSCLFACLLSLTVVAENNTPALLPNIETALDNLSAEDKAALATSITIALQEGASVDAAVDAAMLTVFNNPAPLRFKDATTRNKVIAGAIIGVGVVAACGLGFWIWKKSKAPEDDAAKGAKGAPTGDDAAAGGIPSSDDDEDSSSSSDDASSVASAPRRTTTRAARSKAAAPKAAAAATRSPKAAKAAPAAEAPKRRARAAA